MFETPSKPDVAATTSIEDGYWIWFFFKNSMIFKANWCQSVLKNGWQQGIEHRDVTPIISYIK